MTKASTRKATAAKKLKDLEVKDAAQVVGGSRPTESLSLNYTKIEYKN